MTFFLPLLIFFADKKFGNLTIYYIWNIQAFNFCWVPYLKCFGTFQLEFEMAELYKYKL